jgi:DNA-binding XRE family transcriptional regulator
MARKANTAPAVQVGPTFVGATPQDMAEQEVRVQFGTKMVLSFEGVLRDLGRLEGLEFTRRVADVAVAQIFENVRTSKAYIGLPYIDEAGKPATIADFEEFCEIKLGKSYRRCLELSQNLRALGPELYEQTEKLGLRNVDYKALRALPGDEQALIKKAIEETQSRDEVLELLQEMAAKHHHEKAVLAKKVEDAEATVEALEKVSANKETLINTQARELSKLKKQVTTLPPDEVLAKIRAELLGYAINIESAIENELRPAFEVLTGHIAEHGGQCDTYLTGCIGQIEQRLRDLRADYGLIQEEVAAWAGLSDPPAQAQA